MNQNSNSIDTEKNPKYLRRKNFEELVSCKDDSNKEKTNCSRYLLKILISNCYNKNTSKDTYYRLINYQNYYMEKINNFTKILNDLKLEFDLVQRKYSQFMLYLRLAEEKFSLKNNESSNHKENIEECNDDKPFEINNSHIFNSPIETSKSIKSKSTRNKKNPSFKNSPLTKKNNFNIGTQALYLNHFNPIMCNQLKNNLNLKCLICGIQFNWKNILKHSESCYIKHEKHFVYFNSYFNEPEHYYCNYYDKSRNGYCSRIKLSCFDHNNKHEKLSCDDVCGFPLKFTSTFNNGDTTIKSEFEKVLPAEFCDNTLCKYHWNWKYCFKVKLIQSELELLHKIDETQSIVKNLKDKYLNLSSILQQFSCKSIRVPFDE